MGGDRQWPVLGLFSGQPAAFGDGDRSAIRKLPCEEAVWLSASGFGDDRQADRTHHGGPDRAVCHYPADHLADWCRSYPQQSALFVPGAFGENLATHGLTEAGAGVGDTFQLGGAVIQITQPRQPCWKVNQRFGIAELSRRMVDTRRSGWLCRVLEPGWVAPDAVLKRLERGVPAMPLAGLWDLTLAARPDPAALEAAADHPALAAAWRLRLTTRARWFREHR